MLALSSVEIPAPALLRRYDVAGPRYTSYPTADRFVEAFDAAAYAHWLEQRAAHVPLSLYVHLPFCDTVCYYCGCNKIATKRRERIAPYLATLAAEADLVRSHLDSSRIEQLHLGGGTPTLLSESELDSLMAMLDARFPRAPDGEYGIEVDPRSTDAAKVRRLGALGFNRMSVGVQDFDPAVQRAVNRIQGFDLTAATVEAARSSGFRSINLDLIYGLPKQTPASFARTLDQVLALAPDRIALYHYAHLPERFAPQRRIDVAMLPSPGQKMTILREAIERLGGAGYQYVGMDHFALPDDDLARAQREGRLHRNFQGYSTRPECDLVGLGVSAIGRIGPTYVQNLRELAEYYDAVRRGELPVARGVLLERDDLARRAVIMALMCHFEVSKEAIATAHLLEFDHYFARELAALEEFAEAGLVDVDAEWISVRPAGRMLIRAIAMVFDRYLRQDERARRYSRVV
jgi:oxygen-independent coproporphyrinogen-3 oxidase